MRAAALIIVSLSLAPIASAFAEKLGEHPAVIVQRLHAEKGYDFASKFYPHPAWLWLHAEAPRPMSDHPAAIIAKRAREQGAHAAVPDASAADPLRLVRRPASAGRVTAAALPD
jgi:hypothetical protein